MATIVKAIILLSDENEILLNPRWPTDDYQKLFSLANTAQEELNLKAHVWIATSGSTAESISATKLVAISKQALQNSASAVNKHLSSDSNDVWAQVLPTFHVGGLGIEIRAALAGAKVVSALKEQHWNADHFHRVVRDEGCTLSALVPAQVYDLVSLSLKAPSSLRAIIVGGGAFEPELYNKARDLGWPVLPSYGMTETSSQIATASLNSLNKLDFPTMDLLTHASVSGDLGFLKVKATSLFTCYAQNSEQGIKIWDPKKDGWFTTEDKGHVYQGHLFVEGRSKDYIKIGGEATNLARLRSLLEASVISANPQWGASMVLLDMPSERLGSEIHLASLLDEKETATVIDSFAQKVLPFEKIRKVYYLDEIPRNALGKVLWAELRKKI